MKPAWLNTATPVLSFTDRIWRYTLSQFGEVILAIMTVVIFLAIAVVYELVRALADG